MTRIFTLLTFLLFSATNSLANEVAANNDCGMIKQEDGSVQSKCTLTESSNRSALREKKASEAQNINAPLIPSLAHTWGAKVYYSNFSENQEAKVEKAIALIKKVIGSEEFKERVLNYKFQGKKRFFDSEGLSNAQIYQKILDGAEIMGNTQKNNTMDVELELYHAATKTIGYTYPNVTKIWMNKKYFNKYSPVQVAGNLMHEWMHKIGFGHATKWSEDRDHSVPYAIGYLMEELTKQHL